jgi:hypothetical protein
MDFFEFILIITSVIYALCMAPLLSGFVRVLQFDGQVKHFLPQILISLYLFMFVLVVWWTIWWFRDVSWHFATYLFVIFEPLLLYVACALVFPNNLDGDQFNMEAHYYKVRVPILTVVLLAVILVFVDGVVMGIESVWHSRRYVQGVSVALILWALIDARRTTQYIFTTGSHAAMFALIAGWFWAPAA